MFILSYFFFSYELFHRDRDDNSVVLDAENSVTSIKDLRGAGR